MSISEPKEKPKASSQEDLLLKKLKKKKKKKHKDGERAKERHGRPKMYHRSCQTVYSGVSLGLAEFLSRINGNSGGGGLLHSTQHQDPASIPAVVRERLGYISPLHCTPTPSLPGLEFGHLIHVEMQANGGASVVRAYSEQLSALSPAEMQRFAQEFVTLSFSEDGAQAACFVMGIIHGAASYLPDFLDYFSYEFPNAPVKMEVLGKKDIETTTMANFHTQVRFHLSASLAGLEIGFSFWFYSSRIQNVLFGFTSVHYLIYTRGVLGRPYLACFTCFPPPEHPIRMIGSSTSFAEA